MEQKLKALYDFMKVNGRNLGYNADLQAQFKKLATAYLRALKKELPFTECKVSFNPGGIAVSGDAQLMGMFSNGTGLYITINEPWGGGHGKAMNFLYRTIQHMKDYTGGSNNYITDSIIEEGRTLKRLEQLCGID